MTRDEKIAEVFRTGERYGVRLLTLDRRGAVVRLDPQGIRETFPEAWELAENVGEPWGARVRFDASGEKRARPNYGHTAIDPSADFQAVE